MVDAFISKEELSLATAGKILAEDPRVPLLIKGVSDGIRRYCGWHVFPVIKETILLDSHGGRWLKLPSLNVKSISALKINDTLIDPASYSWSKRGLIHLKSGRFPDDYQRVEVTFEHGFDNGSDLKQVAIQIITNALASPMGVTREQAGSLSVSWSSTAPGVSGGLSILERDKALLDQYRLEEFE